MTAVAATGNGEARLAVVVVRYKKPLQQISVLRALPDMDSSAVSEIVIMDNSPESAGESDVAGLPEGVSYRWLGGNVGLAKAYNSAIDQLRSDWTHVVFLDQDTAGLESLFGGLQGVINAEISVPVVRAGRAIISPCRRLGPWYLPIRSLGTTPRNVSWINSGMTVGRAALAATRFDESLFLDYVDHQFARAVQAGGARAEVRWDVVLEQDYSRSSDDEQQALTRFRIFNLDVRRFYRDTIIGPPWARALTLRRALAAAIQYRSTAFLAIWLRTGRATHD